MHFENFNVGGSIKIRPAYSMLHDLIDKNLITPNTTLVESTSGNLGGALACLAEIVKVPFKAIVDPVPVMPLTKKQYMESLGIDMITVEKGLHPDHRSARIALARKLNEEEDVIWVNQYENPLNHDAHFKYTGPDVLSNAGCLIDYFVCSVGTGGTITGTARYLKSQCPGLRVVATEPKGSTIFGGEPKAYLSVGAGLCEPTPILNKHWHLIDYYCQVEDGTSIKECIAFQQLEGKSVGITTGSCLAVAKMLSSRSPGCTTLIIASDGGGKYESLFKHYEENPSLMEFPAPFICKPGPPAAGFGTPI